MFASTGIRLKFEGQANVSWTEESTSGTGENETKTTTSYTAHETYFSQETLLLGICEYNIVLCLKHGCTSRKRNDFFRVNTLLFY